MRIRGSRRWTSTQSDSTGAFAENIGNDFDPFPDYNYPSYNAKDDNITPDTSLNISDNSSPVNNNTKQKGFFKTLKKIGKRKPKKDKDKGDLVGLVDNDSCVIKFNFPNKEPGCDIYSNSSDFFDDSLFKNNVQETEDPVPDTDFSSYPNDHHCKDNGNTISFFDDDKLTFSHSCFSEISQDEVRTDLTSSVTSNERTPTNIHALESWKPSTNSMFNLQGQTGNKQGVKNSGGFAIRAENAVPSILPKYEQEDSRIVDEEVCLESSSSMFHGTRESQSSDSMFFSCNTHSQDGDDKFTHSHRVEQSSDDLQDDEDIQEDEDPTSSKSLNDEGNNSVISSTSNLTLGMLAQISGLADLDDENLQKYGKTYSEDENDEEDDDEEVEKAAQLSNDFPSTEVEEVPNPMSCIPRSTVTSLDEVEENEMDENNLVKSEAVIHDSVSFDKPAPKPNSFANPTLRKETMLEKLEPSYRINHAPERKHPSGECMSEEVEEENHIHVKRVKDTWIQRDARNLFYKKYEKDINEENMNGTNDLESVQSLPQRNITLAKTPPTAPLSAKPFFWRSHPQSPIQNNINKTSSYSNSKCGHTIQQSPSQIQKEETNSVDITGHHSNEVRKVYSNQVFLSPATNNDDDNESCCSRSSVADKIAAFEKPIKSSSCTRRSVPKIPPRHPSQLFKNNQLKHS